MFLGTHSPKLDAKGRLFLPAKYRDDFSEGLVVTRGLDRSLMVLPEREWEAFTEKLVGAPQTNKQLRAYQRMVFSAAVDQTPDKQGRISIPAELRTYAGLAGEVRVIGNRDHLEIWDPTAWDTYLEEQEDNYADLSEEIYPGI